MAKVAITELDQKFTKFGAEMVRTMNQLRICEKELEDKADAMYDLEKYSESQTKQAADDADKVREAFISTSCPDRCAGHWYLGRQSIPSGPE